MPVPYQFSKVPGGTTIPLAELDANFEYLSINPTLGNLNLSGDLSVAGTSNFSGDVVANNMTVNGSLTIQGTTVTPLGFTGSGLVVLNTNPTLIAPALGTPDSGNLTNCTGYRINQINGLASGILPFLTNPTSTNLQAAITDETGSGNLVFSNNPVLSSPTFVNASLGTPISGNLANCTGFPGGSITGIVPIASGGTGLSSTGSVGQILGVTATNTLGYLSAPPSANIAAGNASQILYQSAPNTTDFIPNGSTGQVLLSNGSAQPGWGSVDVSTFATGVLPTAHGGTGNSVIGTGVQTAMTLPVNTTGGFATYPVASLVPAGAVMFFAMSTPPSGWIVANGAAISRTTYSALFAAIGTLYGPGDGSTTFNLPNLNGQFVRGWDSTGTVDPGRTFGSNQTQSFASHTHTATVTDPGHVHTMTANGGADVNGGGYTWASTKVNATFTSNSALTGISVANTATGGTETRPVNVALLACIKI